MNVEGFKWKARLVTKEYEYTLANLDEEIRNQISPFNCGLELFEVHILGNPDGFNY